MVSPSYEKFESALSRNDYALIELWEPLKFGQDSARPACLFQGDKTKLADYTWVSAGYGGEKEKVIHLNGKLKEQTNQTEKNPNQLIMTSLNREQVNSTFLSELTNMEFRISDEFIFATPSVLETSFRQSNSSSNNTTSNSTEPVKPVNREHTCLLASGR